MELQARSIAPAADDVQARADMTSGQSWWGRFRSWLRGEPAPRRTRLTSAESTHDFQDLPSIAMSAGDQRLRVGYATTKGNVRENNEDNYYVPGVPHSRGGEPPKPGDKPAPGPEGLFLVADGMGGQQAGELASQMAVELIAAELGRRLAADDGGADYPELIRQSVRLANSEILAAGHLQPELSQMGTTLVLALFRGGRAYVTWLGDSRAYHDQGGKLTQLTRDHSLANALGEAGTIRPEEVETHRFRNVLYLYLGSKDVGDGPEDVRFVECRPGDRFLLASDGLTGVVRDEVIAEILRSTDEPQRAATLLVNRALENQSKDNITCVVVQVD